MTTVVEVFILIFYKRNHMLFEFELFLVLALPIGHILCYIFTHELYNDGVIGISASLPGLCARNSTDNQLLIRKVWLLLCDLLVK